MIEAWSPAKGFLGLKNGFWLLIVAASFEGVGGISDKF